MIQAAFNDIICLSVACLFPAWRWVLQFYRQKKTFGILPLGLFFFFAGSHSRSLAFKHPVKEEDMLIEAPVPVDGFWDKFNVLLK